MDFDEWYAGQKHQLSNEQVCRVIWDAAQKHEREACAVLCDAAAMKMEQEAQAAIDNGEHGEVSAIRSTAWKLSVAAAYIRQRSNARDEGLKVPLDQPVLPNL